jgi:hypothetical protein
MRSQIIYSTFTDFCLYSQMITSSLLTFCSDLNLSPSHIEIWSRRPRNFMFANVEFSTYERHNNNHPASAKDTDW